MHTFVAGVFRVGLRARGVAFGLVYLAFVFITFWVAIGTVIHKNYYTPTPVRNSLLFFPILSSLLGSVLVLDKSSVSGRPPSWRIHLDVDCTICLGNTLHSPVFLGGGLLVDR